MNILAIGDVVGDVGVDFLYTMLRFIKEDENIDFCIANGENSANRNGITIGAYNKMVDAGVDVITLGNHAFAKKDIVNLLSENENIIRPSNYPEDVMGRGSVSYRVGDKKIGVINLIGRMNLINVDCPFKAADTEIEKLNDCDIIIVDFHAEVSSEKLAMGYYLDGRVTCVFGTHTHIQTADEQILPRGTGYISDIGMSGAIDSILGVKKDIIINRYLTQVGQKFENAEGRAKICGAVFEIDDNTNKCLCVKRVNIV